VSEGTRLCKLSQKPQQISFFALRLCRQFATESACHRKNAHFSRVFGDFQRGAVTLHQELNGITQCS